MLAGIALRSHQEEAIQLMSEHDKVRIIAPTSAGKSLIIFQDIYNKSQESDNSLFVIVSSRILLLQQLSYEFSKFFSGINIAHMHSGDTGHRKITDMLEMAYWVEKTQGPKVVFVTYNSLHKIGKAELDIDAVYLDECHNASKTHFFEYVKAVEKSTRQLYSLTATPRYHPDPTKNGNNNEEI
jgi:superfamily II DNA or RNA helicase